jgi:hypothetical protein
MPSSDKAPPARTRLKDQYDGSYTAACPGCGEDTTWNAFSNEPGCRCGGKS